jgi:hypothetical protein
MIPCGHNYNKKKLTLTGWGIVDKDIDKFIADAKATGFDELITFSNDTVHIKKAVDAGNKHQVKIYSCITPMNEFKNIWNNQYPGEPLPWQVMGEDEEAARKFIMAGINQYIIPYQFGGEPQMTNEVLINRIACFNNKEYRKLLEQLIDKIVSVQGIAGVALDGFGYENYHCCYCDKCKNLLSEFKEKNPGMSDEEAKTVFFRSSLVDYINYLSNYARSKNRNIKTCIHIWPVFSPDPLYGNRLDVDFCGQTAAWYTLWPVEKIARYSRIITGEDDKYYKRQQGVCMIGYYDRPGRFPVKDATRIDMELKTMIGNGSTHIQVCGTNDVISKPEIVAVFKKYFN